MFLLTYLSNFPLPELDPELLKIYNIKSMELSKIALLLRGLPVPAVLDTLILMLILLQLISFHFFTSIRAYGYEPVSSSPIIINEIEINTRFNQNEQHWIELLNTGDSPVSISKLNLNFIVDSIDGGGKVTQVLLDFNDYKNDTYSFTLAAHDYHVINIPRMLDLFNASVVTIQLFQGQFFLDEVEWINDNIADGRTWQRFPDGKDRGFFEDWIFADASKGKQNGNIGQIIAECYLNPLCMNIDIPSHKSEIINVNGTNFTIDMLSTSSISDLSLDQNHNKMSVKISERRTDSDLSFLHLTFPKVLVGDNFLVNIDDEESQQFFLKTTNDTHSRLVIEYQSGDRTIEILGTTVIP